MERTRHATEEETCGAEAQCPYRNSHRAPAERVEIIVTKPSAGAV